MRYKFLMVLALLTSTIALLLYSQSSYSYLNEDGIDCKIFGGGNVANPAFYLSSLEWREPYGDISNICSALEYGVTFAGFFTKSPTTWKLYVQCPEIEVCADGTKDEDEDECPDHDLYFEDSTGLCRRIDDNCEIGQSTNLEGTSCEPDDCSAGQYSSPVSNTCKDIPCPSGQTRSLGICTSPDGGGDGDGGDPDGGGDGDGGDPDGGGGGGSIPNCDTYSACRDIALEELACKENDRDHFIYQYIGPDDYAAECETCDGPEYLLYDECQNGVCDFGYDAQNNRC